LASGPGIDLKSNTKKALKNYLKNQIAFGFDADALNILAENKSWLDKIPENSFYSASG
jgi:NAD(P)H-hydrate repair Nnr-like enzyme with NAD(P)H-hydrate dehydratase domain